MNGDTHTKNRFRTVAKSAIARWRSLPVEWRIALVVASMGIIGSILGGVCGALVERLPSSDDNQATPVAALGGAATAEEGRSSLHVAGTRFFRQYPGLFFKFPPGSDPAVLLSESLAGGPKIIVNSEAYDVLYWNADFSMLPADFPGISDLPLKLLTDERPYPLTALQYELWNLHKQYSLVIDEVRLTVTSYEPPVTDPMELYYLPPPERGGGGPSLPIHEFNTVLSPASKPKLLFQAESPSKRVVVEPLQGIVVALNISFKTPGTYRIKSAIDFHLPDGEAGSIDSDEYVFSWVQEDLVKGTDAQVLR